MDDLIIVSDPRPTRADAVRNRDLILCTARRMFEEQGVESVTMSAIAQEADVGKGTLYRNFPDKFSLLQELLDHDQRQLQERSLEHLRQGGQPTDNLFWFLENVLSFVWRKLDMLGGAEGWMPLDFPAHYWWRQTIRGLIRQIAPTFDAEYLADVLYLMIDPRTILYQRDARHLDSDQIAASLKEIARRLIFP